MQTESEECHTDIALKKKNYSYINSTSIINALLEKFLKMWASYLLCKKEMFPLVQSLCLSDVQICLNDRQIIKH